MGTNWERDRKPEEIVKPRKGQTRERQKEQEREEERRRKLSGQEGGEKEEGGKKTKRGEAKAKAQKGQGAGREPVRGGGRPGSQEPSHANMSLIVITREHLVCRGSRNENAPCPLI